jgi:hypothetical protein
MKDAKYPTIFPDLLGERFQLQKFSAKPNFTSAVAPVDRDVMKEPVNSIIKSILDAKEVIGSVKWRGAGFAALETLARTIAFAISLKDEIETYHQLAWLRSWMFWFDLRQTSDGDEENILTGHFYALLLAVVPIFPARYQESLAEACRRRIRAARQAISEDPALVEEVL